MGDTEGVGAVLADNRNVLARLKVFAGEPEHQLVFRVSAVRVAEPPPAAGTVDQLTDAAHTIQVAHDTATDRVILKARRIDPTILTERSYKDITRFGIPLGTPGLPSEFHDDAAERGGKLNSGQDRFLCGVNVEADGDMDVPHLKRSDGFACSLRRAPPALIEIKSPASVRTQDRTKARAFISTLRSPPWRTAGDALFKLRASRSACSDGAEDWLGLKALPCRPACYDLMSGLDWPNTTQNHAQDIDDQRRGRHIYARHWRRMAEACGLSKPGVPRRIDGLTTRLLAELPAAADEVSSMPAGPGAILATFVASIGDRAGLVQANAKREGDDVEPPAAEPQEQRHSYGDL